ncbi:MAG: methionine adenosyltransferase [Pseudomonadota bacterium]
MQSTNYLFTSESVSEGHPDKVCDRISDSILDLLIKRDQYARVAVETMATTQRVMLAGEIRCQDIDSKGHLSPELNKTIIENVRQCVRDIGYRQDGFDWQKIKIDNHLHGQSPDIAQGVDHQDQKLEGAGDQGIMFGFACDETDVLMPAAIQYSHAILRSLSQFWHENPDLGLGPDAKSQVTLRYKNGRPIGAKAVVVSIQHHPNMSQKEVHKIVRRHVEKALPEGWMPDDDEFYVNPTGIFVIGGPDGDAGLTGRKIIVDTYGGSAPHGGGAFSGKDPSKVDRSAAYAARYLAKNVVAAGLSKRCLIQLSYAIGVAKPLSVYVKLDDDQQDIDYNTLINCLQEKVNLSPWGIRQHLDLHRPIYTPTSSYGHFGRHSDGTLFPWEQIDLVEFLQKEFKK